MKYKIEPIIKKLLVKYPDFSEIINNAKFIPSNEEKTASTDGENVYYNPEFIKSLNKKQQLMLLAHEVCHIALDHIKRLDNKNLDVWNVATDAVINANLERDGCELIKNCIRIKDALDYDSEELYEKLIKEYEKQKINIDKIQQGQGQQGQSQQGHGQHGQQGQQGQGQQGHGQHGQIQTGQGQHGQAQTGQDQQGQFQCQQGQYQKGQSQLGQGQQSHQNQSPGGQGSGRHTQNQSSQSFKDEKTIEEIVRDIIKGEDTSKVNNHKSWKMQNKKSNSSNENNNSNSPKNKSDDSSNYKDSENNNSNSLVQDNNEDNNSCKNSVLNSNLNKTKNDESNNNNKFDSSKDGESKAEENEQVNDNSNWNDVIDMPNFDKRNYGKSDKKIFEQNRTDRLKRIQVDKERLKRQLQSFDQGLTDTYGEVNIGEIGNYGQPIDWRRLLRESTIKDVDWTLKNAEIEYGIVISRLEEITCSETEIVLDTSGSVSETLLRNFLRECKNILKNSKIKVGCFDTRFYGFQEIKTMKDIENFNFKGFGGTDFDAAVNAFSKRVANKIIFTDGYAPMPNKKVNALWLVYGDESIKPAGGKVIYITPEMLNELNDRAKILRR